MKKKPLPKIGWREWVSLPDLAIPFIKAKVDTGARTSALHAFALRTYKDAESGIQMVRFDIHPYQHDVETVISCTAPVVDERLVTDSGGHQEKRVVIRTSLVLGNSTRVIDITLTERENMLFRMLLGRSAIRRKFLVDPARSFLTTKIKTRSE